MKRKIDIENKVVFFEGDYPSVMGVPHLMKRDHPGFSHQVLSPQRFKDLDFPLTSSLKHSKRKGLRKG